MIRSLALALAVLVACSGAPGGPSMHNSMNGAEPAAQSSVVSAEILAREPIANLAQIKHILIGWGETDHDPRATKRSKQDAETEVRALMDQLKAGADFDALMKQHSEDGGSASSGQA